MTEDTTTDTALSTFNDLVRAAYEAQEAFESWDDGATWVDGLDDKNRGNRKRLCTLAEVTAEWREANAALIDHILDHASAILEQDA